MAKKKRDYSMYLYKKLSEKSESGWENYKNEPWFREYSNNYDYNRQKMINIVIKILKPLTGNLIIYDSNIMDF